MAVSGGVDSMVLLHVCVQAKVDVVAAHCNFTLRGEESDADEALVKEVCGNYGIGCHIARMDTATYATQYKLSTQEAARELRYDWFRKLQDTYGYAAILTAHHATDQVETMLLQITRGTGFKGVQGMAEFHQGIARPLLSWSRGDIESYARTNHVIYREDSSNATDKYARNLLRHQVLPVLEQVNPAYEEHFLQTSLAVQQLTTWFAAQTEKWVKKYVRSTQRTVRIPINEVLKHQAPLLLLYELLQPFDFGFAVVKQVFSALSAQSGKSFYSHTHRLIKDRDVLILSRLVDREVQKQNYFIQKEFDVLHTPFFSITIDEVHKPENLEMPPGVALLDKNTLTFPLVVRPWQPGDKFKPLGMKGHKKVSDFLTDLKLSLEDKERVWVVESNGKLVWVAGWRIDNRYKITKSTTRVFCLTWYPTDLD